jgi:hypothetical protein
MRVDESICTPPSCGDVCALEEGGVGVGGFGSFQSPRSTGAPLTSVWLNVITPHALNPSGHHPEAGSLKRCERLAATS